MDEVVGTALAAARAELQDLAGDVASLARDLPGVGSVKVYVDVEDRPCCDVVAYDYLGRTAFRFSHEFGEGEL